jgi:hypothetical protein
MTKKTGSSAGGIAGGTDGQGHIDREDAMLHAIHPDDLKEFCAWGQESKRAYAWPLP